MAGGDELVRVARNKIFLPQNVVPGWYYLYMHLENKINTQLHFFQKINLCRKKKNNFTHIYLILDR